MKANPILSKGAIFALAMIIAFLASALRGSMFANASDMEEGNVATTRHFTMVYENPEAGKTVAFVLMPETEVSLAGRSVDSAWLALGNGWVQKDDIRSEADLASLPVMATLSSAQTFTATTRHLSMVYEAPTTNSRVETVLMPETEVSLAGRGADGKWLALTGGWIQNSDVRTDADLATLPILNAANALDQIAGQ